MSSHYSKALTLVGATIAGMGSAHAQASWPVFCQDPSSGVTLSIPFVANLINNELFGVAVGGTGTITYGGDAGCFDSIAANVSGRFSFGSIGAGSIQSSADDGMAFTYGWPFMGNSWGTGAYITGVAPDTVLTTHGSSASTLHFSGVSDRYILDEHVETGVNIRARLQVDIIGDGCRVAWRLTNTGTTPQPIGLWVGHMIAILDGSFTRVAGSVGKNIFASIPGQKLPTTERRYIRELNSANFPSYVNFMYSQAEPYGIQVLNGPLDRDNFDIVMRSESGLIGEADTQVDEFVLGQAFFLLGAPPGPGTFPDVMFPSPDDPNASDVPWQDDPGYIQKYNPITIAAGQSRNIVQYYKTVWGVTSFARPFTAVVDAPRMFAYNPSTNDISPNPGQVRVHVDNTRGFSSADREISLSNVRVTFKIRKNGGMSFGPGVTVVEANELIDGELIPIQKVTRTILSVPARAIRFVDFVVIPDGVTTGFVNWWADITADPGDGTPRRMKGQILSAAAPKLNITRAANLLTSPWEFTDSSWTNVLDIQDPTVFQAYRWDPQQQGYVISTSAQRGIGNWIVSKIDFGFKSLNETATQPSDIEEGAPLLRLKSGWNLIGNPYNYPVQLGQLVGASGANVQDSFTWEGLVANQFVSGAMAYWDQTTQSYKFISGNDAWIESNRGYWVFVFTQQDLFLQFPPVLAEGLPTSTRSTVDSWNRSDSKWRLNLAARSTTSIDDQNFVGRVATAAEANRLTVLKPPMAPTQTVNLSIEQMVNGKSSRVAQALTDKSGRQEWKVIAESVDAGPVVLTWPNASQLPRNLRVRLVDVATGATKDMRQTSGYTYEAEENSSREFRVQIEQGGASRAVIGNIIVTGDSRDASAPFNITYSLSTDATTTVRVLSSSGREVFTVTRGRADRSGENTVTWARRDNANRAVAPGTYRIEIVAETASGERVRKIYPINVIR